jgi:hypothetical protein
VPHLRVGEPLYLLTNFRCFTGTNEARRWAPVLRVWIADAEAI